MNSVAQPLYLGLDIGGTKVLAAAADGTGTLLNSLREATPSDLESGLSLLHRMISRLSGNRPIAAIGSAVGGPLDRRRGIVSPLHQLAWREVPLKSIMEQTWGCPFYVDVDTNVAALGEYHFGSDRPRRLLYVTLSTGMGGGLLVDGQIYRGLAGEHPEPGHQSVNWRCSHPEKVVCECGAPDCLEALVSGNAIRRIYNKPAEKLRVDEWNEVAYNLGQGLRNLAVLYLPDTIVLGGGVALGGGSRLLTESVRHMKEGLRLVPSPTVRLSRLGHETAVRGAVALALHGSD